MGHAYTDNERAYKRKFDTARALWGGCGIKTLELQLDQMREHIRLAASEERTSTDVHLLDHEGNAKRVDAVASAMAARDFILSRLAVLQKRKQETSK